MDQTQDRIPVVIASIAWIGLAIPGLFFAMVGFLGIGFSNGGADAVMLGGFLILFPVLAVGSVIACWLLRAAGRHQAARIAIVIPAFPALVEIALMIKMM
ncbi:hypothetical protein TSH100_11880 [Azospirillum sp. TSH100]|uniref:hypothetical protein n=1 Tax=Azospirillum sp. TSH100 TaxID=652764 RepID=UPI000D620EA1|nr:hypothetical protein [Azospirillum sp. TSH100]PWC86480.1 hypothetical protein TSH100_11880 [Azospirillum sp. TSH100]QCG88397.1 hypothetical protein E6C72_12135 [Azospirillum sp. TSH100]